MARLFFPDVSFAIVYLAALAAALVAVSYFDLRYMIIPKSISLAAAAGGFALNVVRGAWLGYRGQPVWLFREPGPAVGAFDGLAFALAGFAFGFVLFFLLWTAGIAGGGDVKFFAALGAWIGPRFAFYVLAVTLVVLGMIVFGTAISAVLTGKMRQFRPGAAPPTKRGRRLVTFGFPLSLSTVIVLAWVLRHELNLVAPA
jgi:Flp pilus assembly protein protease CpaA